MPKTSKKSGIQIAGMHIREDYLLGIGLIMCVIIYALTKIEIFAYSTLILLVWLFLKDAAPAKADSKGIISSVKELAIALVAALALWYGLSFILQSPTPIDVVTSCSMLPALDRGDLIILQGGEMNARYVELNNSINMRDFVTVDCKIREIASGVERDATCTTGLRSEGKVYDFDTEGDIVVYEPNNALRNVGLIVHRAVLKVKYNGEIYYIIKGDNNQLPDIVGISSGLATADQIKGKTIIRVPLVGYLKLFLSFQFAEPPNCKFVIENQKNLGARFNYQVIESPKKAGE